MSKRLFVNRIGYVFLLVIMAVVFIIGATFLFWKIISLEYREPVIPKIIHVSTMMDVAFFNDAYAQAPQLPEIPEDTRGAVVPHHLLPAPITAAFFNQFPWQPKRVIIVGPDHLHRATAPAVVSKAMWKTPYGMIFPDEKGIATLLASGMIKSEETVFEDEHSIAALVPFVKHSFPDAKIIPIVVQNRFDFSIANMLAEALPIDEHTLVIASVDFSHGQADRVAQLHDAKSRAVLSSFEIDALQDLEIDSPASLAVLLGVMQKQGAEKMTLLKNTNSAQVTQDRDASEGTSYVYVAFSNGAVVQDDAVTMLAVGDMMFDRSVRELIEEHGNEYVFEHIRGSEDRFFRGVDVITGNLEGAISPHMGPVKSIDFGFDDSVAALLAKFNFDVVSLSNNHALDQGRIGFENTKAALDKAGVAYSGDQVRDDTEPWVREVRGKRIAMFAYNITDNDFDEEAAHAKISAARAASDIVIIQIHWGAEYLTRPQQWKQALGRELIDWGADVVIGGHPHVMQGMEVYKGRPIFWSLGNFIFDQYWSEETQRALAVGFIFRDAGVTAYLYPIVSEASQPRLAVGEGDRAQLEEFVRRSNLSEELQKQARTGKVELHFE